MYVCMCVYVCVCIHNNSITQSNLAINLAALCVNLSVMVLVIDATARAVYRPLTVVVCIYAYMYVCVCMYVYVYASVRL